MYDPVFGKIQKFRQQAHLDRQSNQRIREQEVRKHELQHARIAETGNVEFYYRRDANNIEHLVHGKVHVDISVGNNLKQTIEKFETLIKAAEAVDNPSAQDNRLKEHLARGLSKLKQFKR